MKLHKFDNENREEGLNNQANRTDHKDNLRKGGIGNGIMRKLTVKGVGLRPG